ncbi:MAG TPA: hypothetical protein VFP40_10290 [Terriglobales bacterium]|nr:hypothetical protein [Terriglobales bacterium]
MNERKLLSGWKEIAAYLNRGVRTVQRWELSYGMPVRRQKADARSVFAFADEIDAWLERTKPSSGSYVRCTFLVVDIMTPDALSDLKLAIEGAKYNVLTAFTAQELLAVAARYDVDGFVVDSILLDVHPSELARELKRRYPSKPRVLVGDDPAEDYDAVLPPGNPARVVDWILNKFGPAMVGEMQLD